jgi:hypothetical protein
MYRIEIDIEEQVLLQVLMFLNGLGTAQKLRKVSQPKTVQKALAPRLRNIKPLRKQLTIKDLLEEQMPEPTNREALERLFMELNIQQPIEVLLAGLKS